MERNNELLLKIKNSIIRMFLVINLKLIKLLTNLLTGDKFMPEMHLKQPGFTYSACGRFTKHREEFKNVEK